VFQESTVKQCIDNLQAHAMLTASASRELSSASCIMQSYAEWNAEEKCPISPTGSFFSVKGILEKATVHRMLNTTFAFTQRVCVLRVPRIRT
jgi:hypothetical protein